MHAFDYEASTSLEEALALLSRPGAAARPLAGGTDLIDQMRLGRHTPQLVVDVKKIPELNVLEEGPSGLRIGAAVPCYRIYGHAGVVARYSALSDSCHIIGGVQIQSRATVGGNLCNSGPAADSTPSLIALGAVVVIAGAGGRREVPADAFCSGPGKNVLQPGELVVELRLPAPAARTGSHYRRLIPRNEMDIAIVGVGAQVTLAADGRTIEAARIGLGAVAPTPLTAQAAAATLVGKPAETATYEAAAEAARQIVSPITDMRGTQEYRIHVTGVLVRRTLEAAVARARGEVVDYRPGH